MDAVDYKYKSSIREALQNGDVDKLKELVPSLSEEDAQNYVESWRSNYLETMKKIRESQDTTDLDSESQAMLTDLMDKSHLSGFHI